jgi:hypothetical protein
MKLSLGCDIIIALDMTCSCSKLLGQLVVSHSHRSIARWLNIWLRASDHVTCPCKALESAAAGPWSWSTRTYMPVGPLLCYILLVCVFLIGWKSIIGNLYTVCSVCAHSCSESMPWCSKYFDHIRHTIKLAIGLVANSILPSLHADSNAALIKRYRMQWCHRARPGICLNYLKLINHEVWRIVPWWINQNLSWLTIHDRNWEALQSLNWSYQTMSPS